MRADLQADPGVLPSGDFIISVVLSRELCSQFKSMPKKPGYRAFFFRADVLGIEGVRKDVTDEKVVFSKPISWGSFRSRGKKLI